MGATIDFVRLIGAKRKCASKLGCFRVCTHSIVRDPSWRGVGGCGLPPPHPSFHALFGVVGEKELGLGLGVRSWKQPGQRVARNDAHPSFRLLQKWPLSIGKTIM